MKRLLLLGAPVFQKPVVEKAKRRGLYVGVADISADALAAPLADEFFQGSIRDYDAMLEVAREFKPDAIASGACDTSVVTVARLCEELGLPGISAEAALNSTDKLRMIECFRRGGVAHPAFAAVKGDALDGYEPEIPYPIIVKPIDSAGSRGVNLVRSRHELLPALKDASAAGVSGNVLVEECMTGPEVSVEVVVADGVPHILQVTDKLIARAIEIGHCQPTSLRPADRASISELARSAVLAVGLRDSVAHVEVMLTPEGPKMVELGARLGGGWITSYLIDNSVRGVDMIGCALSLALGEGLGTLDYGDSGDFAMSRFLLAPEGVLLGLEGLDEAAACPDVVHVEFSGFVGKRYPKPHDNSARIVSVIAKGATKAEARSNCEHALEKIRLKTG